MRYTKEPTEERAEMSEKFLKQLEQASKRANTRMDQISRGQYKPTVKVHTHGFAPLSQRSSSDRDQSERRVAAKD